MFQRTPTNYCLDRSLPEMEKWMADLGYTPDMPLAVDIETPETDKINEEDSDDPDKTSYTIIRCGFSFRSGTACSYPWTEPYISYTRTLLSLAHTVVLHNGGFDRPRLSSAGCPIKGKVIDTMWMFHFLQSDLPKSLEFVAPFYCLAAATRVRLWGTNKTIKISDLVTTKQQVILAGCDEDGMPTPVQVVAWHKRVVKGQKWLAIHTGNTKQPIYCTPDHQVWTTVGALEAQYLHVGVHKVIIPKLGHNSLIHGTVLGDGCVDYGGQLSMSHCMADQEWAWAKAHPFNVDCKIHKTSPKSYTGGKDQWGFSVPVGMYWRKLFYPEGKKVFVPPPDDAALAVWYGDDGCMTTSATGKHNARIAIAGFVDKAPVYAWFRAQLGEGAVSGYGVGTHSESVALKLAASYEFFDHIAPWLHPSMERKLPKSYRGRYNGWLELPAHQHSTVTAVEPYIPPKWSRRRDIRYCVTVDHPTHRFFTDGGLVSNCDVAPWKHLSQAAPAFYNATDNDVTLRCFEAMRDWLIRQGRWERFTRHCSDTAEILGEMSTAGVLVDVEARSALQNALRGEIAVLDSTIQAAIPRELLPTKILKTERTLKELPDEERTNWEPTTVKCECKRMRKGTGRCLICDGTGTTIHFRKLLPFNWNSTDQTQELAKHYGFTIPKKRGEDREALESKTLRKFGKRKPVFLDIWNARKRYKLISTYDWALGSDGRVRSKFGFHPSTWRKSSRDPNLQNIPANGDLAGAFRRTIIAAPGHVLIEADSKSIEAVLVGYDAGDPEYIRIAKAGVHDFFMSHVRAHHEGGHGIDRSLPLDELVRACAEAKAYDKSLSKLEQRRDHCKKTVHGSNYGLSPYGMADEYQDLFPKQRDAEILQEMYFALFPKIKQWMRTTREQADRQTFLDNHYQYRHYFYAVTKWNSKYQRFDLGTDAKRCIAFLPQSDASAIQTEDLLTLAADPIIRPMLRLIIHDSHVLECPLEMVDYACGILHTTMSRPRPELGGLEIGVEIKWGPNLQDTEVWKG